MNCLSFLDEACPVTARRPLQVRRHLQGEILTSRSWRNQVADKLFCDEACLVTMRRYLQEAPARGSRFFRELLHYVFRFCAIKLRTSVCLTELVRSQCGATCKRPHARGSRFFRELLHLSFRAGNGPVSDRTGNGPELHDNTFPLNDFT